MRRDQFRRGDSRLGCDSHREYAILLFSVDGRPPDVQLTVARGMENPWNRTKSPDAVFWPLGPDL
jgi:hypothetical protein